MLFLQYVQCADEHFNSCFFSNFFYTEDSFRNTQIIPDKTKVNAKPLLKLYVIQAYWRMKVSCVPSDLNVFISQQDSNLLIWQRWFKTGLPPNAVKLFVKMNDHQTRDTITVQESLADAKVSARQQCVYEGLWRRNLQKINDMWFPIDGQ